MYAIVEAGGQQWRVEPGSQLVVNRLEGAVGNQHVIDRVLLTSDGETVQVGRPYLTGAQVLCEVLEHRKGEKVVSYKFRRRENYRRTRGHRQLLTKLLVKDINLAQG
ncbi:MAG: 50S ribosomal protein L21 [Candidatus Omnitrophica bacterium]|nr:50S ribosomal protein L21 [Candidatus Omnitrophota bacterium]